MRSSVLIVGGGPVGLTLAVSLGRLGIDCVLVDEKAAPLNLPKMERCNARSMEIYRRLGLADEIRAAGFPTSARMDVAVVTRLADEPLVRLTYPTVDEAILASRACNDGTLPLEPYQVISQYTLEPLLKRAAEAVHGLEVRFGWELLSFEQDQDGVRASVRSVDGRFDTIHADYLVGCDGGRSTVRKQLGIELSGDGGIGRRNQVFFRSDDLFDLCPSEQCRMYFFANEDRSSITVQDDLKHFSFGSHTFGDENEMRELILETIGLPISLEILAMRSWTQHLLVADRFRDGRVFLAGDAVRLVIPAGALGLNTGIGDVTDLAWKLAATIQGWGGPALLDSYEAERRPIALRNREASRYASQGQREWRELVRPDIRADTPEGAGVRRVVGYRANVVQRRTHEMVGAELGYRYERSAVICSEDGPWPPDVPEVYIPTGRPGARLPHIWLRDGSALHDHIGAGYTLIRLSPSASQAEALRKAMVDLGAPVDLVDVDEPDARRLYGADLLLLRPDLHVAWRGDHPPEDPVEVARRVTGHGARADRDCS